MLVPAKVGIALRCPRCSKMVAHEVPLFAFSGVNLVPLTCACGQEQGALQRRRGRVALLVSCGLCDGTHRLDWSAARFWSGAVHPLICHETGLHLGVLGSPAAVRPFKSPTPAGADPDLAEPGDFFVNPAVMCEVLAAVHELDAAGRLRCRCGNTDIEYELQPDRLDLVCPVCGSRRSLGATRAADAVRARRARRMEIGRRKRQDGR